jgi:hypothetical protein
MGTLVVQYNMTIGTSSEKQRNFDRFSVEKNCTIFSNNKVFLLQKRRYLNDTHFYCLHEITIDYTLTKCDQSTSTKTRFTVNISAGSLK